MYIHVGDGKSIRRRDVIGIFDLDGEMTADTTADFLKKSEKSKITNSAGTMLPKSFVLWEKAGKGSKKLKIRVRGKELNSPRVRMNKRKNQYKVTFSHIGSVTLGFR